MSFLPKDFPYKEDIEAIKPTDPVYYDTMNKNYLGQLLSNIKRIVDGEKPINGVAKSGAWKAKTAYSAGQVVYPTSNGLDMTNQVRMIAKNSGTSGDVEPTGLDVKKVGEEVKDNTMTWTVFRQQNVLSVHSVDDIVKVEMRNPVKHGETIDFIKGFPDEYQDFIASPSKITFPKNPAECMLHCYVGIQKGSDRGKLYCYTQEKGSSDIIAGEAFVLVTAVKKP